MRIHTSVIRVALPTTIESLRRGYVSRRLFFASGRGLRFLLGLFAIVAITVAALPRVAADKPPAQPLITDRENLPLSDKFGSMGLMGLSGAGDVLFTATGVTVFRWDASSGSRTRLLQAGDPHPGFPGSVSDIVGGGLQVNTAGHAAMVNFFVQKNARSPRGVFVFDGTDFLKVAIRGEVAPGTGGQLFESFVQQLRINDGDQVAFVVSFGPIGLDAFGIFLGSPTSAPAKIAAVGDTAPGTGGGAYANFQLIGLNNAGQVAFVSNITGGSTPRAVFIGSASGVSKVAALGDPAPGTSGTFNLQNNLSNYFLNASGDVAFFSPVTGGPSNQGIWIGNGTAAPAKLAVNTDPTGTTLGGTFGPGIFLHGFNNSGKAVFRSNPVGATRNHALFLKDLTSAAQVVFARNDPAPGGTTEVLFNTLQAALNNNDHVAFLAQLQGGPSKTGWFLGSGSAAPSKIVLEGEPTPAGGTYGLAGANQAARINASDQVVFFSDILGPNVPGLFLRSSSGVVPIVNGDDTMPGGANPVIRTFLPGASDDQLLFYAWKAGGRVSAFTKPLKPGGGQITRIFGEGDTAPGIGGALWVILANFGQINDSEEVAFATNLVIGGSVYPASMVFTHKPGVGLQKVAATGDAAPGAAGGTFANFDVGTFSAPPGRINTPGEVAFIANISGSAGNLSRVGIFIGSAGTSPQAIARMNDPSPIGGTFISFQATDISLNDVGQVAFAAVSQSGPTRTEALFVGSGASSPVKVVKQGDTGPGGSTVSLTPLSFQINNAGQVAYVAELTGGPSSQGVFLGTAGGLQSVVALVGDPAPGTGGGTFSRFREPDLEVNNSGKVAFWAEVAGSSARSGYFLGSATVPPAARLVEGQALPGGGSAGFVTPGFNNFIGEPFTLSDSGEMSMFVGTSDPAKFSRQVIANPSGTLREFLSSGEKATGTGSVVGGVFQSVAVNSKGQFFDSAILVEGPAKWAIFSDR